MYMVAHAVEVCMDLEIVNGSARCSFCGRPHSEGKRIIAGETASICSECVVLCTELIANPDLARGFEPGIPFLLVED